MKAFLPRVVNGRDDASPSPPWAPGSRDVWTGLLLLLASGLHVAALFVPFVEMRALFSTAVYGLIPSVLMLLDYGMVVLALLVIAFSIIFPFAKLTVLWRAWAVVQPSAGLGRVVHVAESLGKWSMLDVFLVLLLLVVTADRALVATQPLAGVPCFLGGVLCTMMAGGLIARRWHGPAWSSRQTSPPGPVPHAVRWLLLGFAASLLAAQLLPLLETDSALLRDRAINLFQVAWSLASSGNWGMAIAVITTLIVLPWLALAGHWRDARRPVVARRGVDAVRRWAMLDVFGLALAIFLIESESTVPSDLRLGGLALGCAVVLSILVAWRLRKPGPG